MTDNFIRECIIERIVDGDTICISADLGFDVWKRIKVRLARINCPEKKTEEGKKIIEYMQQYVGQKGNIQSLRYDKYGRGLCEIEISGLLLSDTLLGLGYAKKRDGQGQKPV